MMDCRPIASDQKPMSEQMLVKRIFSLPWRTIRSNSPSPIWKIKKNAAETTSACRVPLSTHRKHAGINSSVLCWNLCHISGIWTYGSSGTEKIVSWKTEDLCNPLHLECKIANLKRNLSQQSSSILGNYLKLSYKKLKWFMKPYFERA